MGHKNVLHATKNTYKYAKKEEKEIKKYGYNKSSNTKEDSKRRKENKKLQNRKKIAIVSFFLWIIPFKLIGFSGLKLSRSVMSDSS